MSAHAAKKNFSDRTSNLKPGSRKTYKLELDFWIETDNLSRCCPWIFGCCI